MKSLAAAAVVSLLAASPAFADCAGSHALDRCLIGTWHYTSGGSAAWMARNIHMAHVTGLTHNGLTIAFNGDGTFSTGQADIRATVAANDGSMSGTGHAVGRASGTWSTTAGHFNFCMTPGSLRATVTIMVQGHPMTVTPPAPTHPQATPYTCSGNTLTTTQPIPGHEPIVTVYARGR
jgi:hypothetical protein